ncbi:ribosomal protection-like ABC-F family protein [Paenibacillus sp. Marseille-Q4541]|uniref:ribosomal protection-like ABC-F family protein n=1 Tax=Paenibacillus sp. Marseille-Q4541 TaxID=2831522 RepID=UPI001BAC0666|nr:ABC-F type ribosomal protection protein [Paenibacillus sp. Marseille-Q4541]
MATTLIHMRNIAKEWNGKPLFENVNLEVIEQERVALFGLNGSGKTTLLRILTGSEGATEGQISIRLAPEEIGFLRQNFEVKPNQTVKEVAFLEGGVWGERKLALLDMEEQMRNAEDMEWLARYGECIEQFEDSGGYGREAELEKMMTNLRIPERVWDLPFESLSGGQKTRLRLAALLTRQPKLLILDEPTNHLDQQSLIWLEEWLLSYQGTLIFVSHDRTFLDHVATAIWELTPSGTQKYVGGYEDYLNHKQRERKEQEVKYRKQELAKKALEESIRKYQEWFNKAHKGAGEVTESKIAASYYKARANKNISRYHAKQKQLERLDNDRVERPKDGPKVNMELKEGSFEARTFVQLEHVDFSYAVEDTVPLLKDINLSVQRGKRLTLQGPNGVGKTTLLKLIIGELSPHIGTVTVHPKTSIGYFSQELEGLSPHMTVLDSLLSNPYMTQTEARTVLGNFLFSKDDVYKRIEDLSKGEQCRVAFIRLYFSGANLLVLDEPTNYLDIETREVMEEALLNYNGAMVFVSHDRTLVRKLANQVLDMSKGKEMRIYDGTMAEYEQSRASQPLTGAEQDDENDRLQLLHRLDELLSRPSEQNGQEKDMNSYSLDTKTMGEIREIRAALALLDRKRESKYE